MALSANSTGYKTLGNDVDANIHSSTRMYVRIDDASNPVLGIVKFTTSIKDFLGLDAINPKWSDIKFSSAMLSLYTGTANFTYNNWSIILSSTLVGRKDLEANLKGHKTTGNNFYGVSANVAKDVVVKFDLASMFNTIPDDCTFQPTDSTWYIYIFHPTQYRGTDRYFVPKNSYTPILDISGELNLPIKIYNDSSWVNGTPYVYNGNDWVKAKAIYRHNGNSWIRI